MNREIDYICHDCQQPVYKCPPGYYCASHVCLSEEERETAEKRRLEWEQSQFKIEIRYVAQPLTDEEKKLLEDKNLVNSVRRQLLDGFFK